MRARADPIVVRLVSTAACLLALALLSVLTLEPLNGATVDLSWPNCQRLPIAEYSSVIVGVSGGLDFHPNPCLGTEGTMSQTIEAYLNTGDPGFPRVGRVGTSPLKCRPDDLICHSYNYGYQAAVYDLTRARLAAVHTSWWWLDVETDNSWTFSVAANRADIEGMIAAILSQRAVQPRIGIYTTNIQWVALVGHWRIGLPLWLGTGDRSPSAAAKACRGGSETGAGPLLAQYTAHNLDYDISCPRSP